LIRLAPSCLLPAVILTAVLASGSVRAADLQTAAAEPPAPVAAPLPQIIPVDVTPAMAAPRSVRIPTSVADVPVERVINVAMNKTQPLDLPSAARDVVVGNPAIADVMVRSAKQVFLMGHQMGDTNVFFMDQNGKLIRRAEVHVGPDAEGARAAISQLLPDDEIEVSPVGDALFLSGTVRGEQAVATARAAARRFVSADANVINRLSVVGPQQVLLKVRVAEVNRTVIKDLGLNTSYSHTGRNTTVTTLGGGSTAFNDTAAASGSILFQPAGLTVNFAALEEHGLLRTLAEPNLSALSGETAKLLAGGEVPIPVSQTNGAVSVEFKPYGVGLVFSPVILGNGRISLKVQSEVSSLDENHKVAVGTSISVPAFLVRRAETVVEMPSGGSLMIAGLLTNSGDSTLNSIPGMKDLPIIGSLFGSTAFNNSESELMVTVTPYLVEPVNAKALSLPTDGFIPSSDLKRYFLMRLQEEYVGKKANALPPQALQGPVGYIVE